MLQIEKEHKNSTLMSMKKEELVKHIMYLEHNNNVLNERIEIQARNCMKLLNKEWIPCSERLPEEDMTCLVTVYDKATKRRMLKHREFRNGRFMQGGSSRSFPIIAWQPLPPKYEGEE